MDTIFALASARGKAGISVVRVSGPQAFLAATCLSGDLPASRHACLRTLKRQDGSVLDLAIVVVFEGPGSFTGEDVVEFHVHGSIATVNAVQDSLGKIDGLRPAEAGEFTRRALGNNRLDLAQVEGLADLIEAETESQRLQSVRLLSGALGKISETWRKQLIRAASLLEATIDFVDEDVPIDVGPEVEALVDAVLADLRRESAGVEVAERIRDGFEVAIIGAPNVGKSTLLNRLAGRDAAITSEIAGTTRDVIEVRMDLRGLPVTFLDTAGLRETNDSVELIGIQRAVERAISADLRIFLVDDDTTYSGISPDSADIVVRAKADLLDQPAFGISGKTGKGISELISRIEALLEIKASGAATATRQRHRISIDKAIVALELVRSELQNGGARAEVAAEELRSAIRSLDSLVGRVDVENILDEIFSSFCIGK